MRAGVLAIALCALMTTWVGCAAVQGATASPSPSTATEANLVVLGEGRDRTASQTAEDWVTYADHVVLVTVVGEIRGQANKTELERQEGMIGRRVTLRVDKVLWSAPNAVQPAPKVLEQEAAGWIFNTNSSAEEMKIAVANYSRLEQGHTYIRALDWVDDPCANDPQQGTWAGLGSGGTLPYDGAVLGAGEFEGRVYTLDEARAEWRDNNSVTRRLRDEMLGQPLDTLVAQLQGATPRRATQIDSRECDLSDR